MPTDKERKPDLSGSDDEAIEARVRRMMDPSIKDEPKKKPPSKDGAPTGDPATAPEIGELPKPKEPMKIKVLDGSAQNDDPEEQANVEKKSTKTERPKPVEPEPPEPEPETEAGDDSDPYTAAIPKAFPGAEEDDAQTVKAVDDIVNHESDELLAAQDEKLVHTIHPPARKSLGARIKAFFRAWWDNPKARWATIIILVLTVGAAAAIPGSRYFVLNSVGVRGGVSVRVLDQSTFQPLKNVAISVAGAETMTDTNGEARLSKLPLGPAELKIQKRAFAPVTQKIVVGWGSNPQHDTSLRPVGAQYSFSIVDFLSGKSIGKAEAISGDASSLSDEKGKIKLTLADPGDKFEVQIKSEGYRTETVQIDATNKDEMVVRMVSARKHVFVSKRSGKLDVYKIDIDGKNEEKILAATGTERDDMKLIVHPSAEVAALVSTRDGKHNKDGFLLSSLVILDLKDNSAKTVATSERVQLVDWVGNRMVYVQVAAGTSAANPKRHRLMSYDYGQNDNDELAATNYFNDVMVAAGKIYYSTSGAYQNGVNVGLYRIDGDGRNRQTILNEEAWNISRVSYEHLIFDGGASSSIYDYRLGDKQATKLKSEPITRTSRVYIDSPSKQKSLWAESRDGKGVLLVYDVEKKDDKLVHTQSGLGIPARWVDEKTIIYHVNTERESADYVISLDGGEAKKIRDVTNTTGVDRWYYY